MMRNVFRLCTVLLIVGMVSSVYAQDQQRRQGRFMRGGNLGVVVNSLLLLQGDKAEKVEAASQSASESAREGIDFQNMSQDDRMQAFREIQQKTQAAFLDQLKGIVSEEELKTVEPFIKSNKNFYRPELVALLSLDLKDEQRTELKSAALAYAKKIEEHAADGFGGMRQDAENAELQAASTAFQDDVKKILDDEQEKKWQASMQEILDARAQRGQGRRGGN